MSQTAGQTPAAAAPALPFTMMVPTIYGPMLVNRHDINQTESLVRTGYAIDHGEILMLAQVLQLLGPDAVVLDIGGCFGTYSLALARFVGPKGKVHVFEPQRLMFNLIVGSVALNSLTNVFCHNVALGDREDRIEIPQFDYNKPLNFGSVEFTPEQSEPLTQTRGHDPSKSEYVPLTTVDGFEFPKVSLMKIDAEGMELQVLRGSEQTIRRCRPVMYVEFLKGDKEALREWIARLDYAVHVSNINFLCIPKELAGRIQIAPAPPARGRSGGGPPVAPPR